VLDCHGIGAADLVGFRLIADGHKLVAGTEDSYSRPPTDLDGGVATGRGDAGLDRPDEDTLVNQNRSFPEIGSLAMDELARIDLTVQPEAALDGDGGFDRDNGIGTMGQRSAGHDTDSGLVTRFKASHRIPGHGLPADLEFPGVDAAGPDRIAIHHDAVKGREVTVRHDGVAEDFPGGFLEWTINGTSELDVLLQKPVDFLD
jgi:hypothetical protein